MMYMPTFVVCLCSTIVDFFAIKSSYTQCIIVLLHITKYSKIKLNSTHFHLMVISYDHFCPK